MRRVSYYYVVCLASAVGALFFVGLMARAQVVVQKDVLINEIMWDGVEYVELFNVTDQDIVLTGWTLTRQRAGGVTKTIVQFDDEDIIATEGYFLIEKNEDASTVDADKVVSALTLVNGGELVTLLDSEEMVVDQANRLGLWFAGENTAEGVAMERSSLASDGVNESGWHTATSELGGRLGTPGANNSEPAVNTAPEATVSGEREIMVGQNVIFSAEDSADDDGDELEYLWLFGDGASAADIEATHSYATAGTYLVVVTVSDGELEDEASLAVTVTLPAYSNKVVINEFLPNPVGPDSAGEFIELRNNGSTSVDLGGWQLDDVDGGSRPYSILTGTNIAAGAVLSWARAETKIALNNGGDTVRLLDPGGTVRSSFSYQEAVGEGQSYNRTAAGTYVLSTTPTAGSYNLITEADGEEEEEEDEDIADTKPGAVAGETVIVVALADLREHEVGTVVETEGAVSVPPGVLGGKVIYLAGSGVQVYFHQEEYPDLALGSRVRVRGLLTTSLGEHRIKLAQASDITVIDSGEVPEPHRVQTGEIDEELEGSLVIIEGEVAQTSGNTFYVNDGSGEIKVYIKKATQIDKPKMKKGTAVTITGVVSRTNTGYRLLPRFQEDVRLGRVAGLTSFPATGERWLWAAALAMVLICLGWQAWRFKEPMLLTGW